MPIGPETEGIRPESAEQNEIKQRIERLRKVIEEYFEDVLALADPKEGFSIVSLMEPAGDERLFSELSEPEKDKIRELLIELKETIGEGVVIEEQKDEEGKLIDIVFKKQEREGSAETVRFTFTGECICGNVISFEGEMPKEPTPKIKKDKKTGRRYRDWRYPKPIPCRCISDITGTPRQVQVYYREWLE